MSPRHRTTPPYPIGERQQMLVPAERPAPEQDGLVVWERAVDLIKNVVVILTCVVILYVVWTGYQALGRLGEGLEQLQNTWVG